MVYDKGFRVASETGKSGLDLRYLGFWPSVIFSIFWGNYTKRKKPILENRKFSSQKSDFFQFFFKKFNIKSLRSDMDKLKTTSFSICFLRNLKNISGVVGCINKKELGFKGQKWACFAFILRFEYNLTTFGIFDWVFFFAFLGVNLDQKKIQNL